MDDIVEGRTRLDNIEKRQKEESDKQESYRVAAHDRLKDVHSQVNMLRIESLKRDEEINRRVDAVEYTTQATAEIIVDFKQFIKGATETFADIKKYINTQEGKSTYKSQTIAFVFKLAAFAATILAILKYTGS